MSGGGGIVMCVRVCVYVCVWGGGNCHYLKDSIEGVLFPNLNLVVNTYMYA